MSMGSRTAGGPFSAATTSSSHSNFRCWSAQDARSRRNVLAYRLVEVADDHHGLHSRLLLRWKWSTDLSNGRSLDPDRRRIGTCQLPQWRIDTQSRHQGLGLLCGDQYPTLDAMHIGVRSDIVRIGTRDERYCVFVDTHLGPVQRSQHDHAYPPETGLMQL